MRRVNKIDWSVLSLLFAAVLTVIAGCVESSGPLGAPNVLQVGAVASVKLTLARSILAPGQATQATVVARSADGIPVSGRVDYLSKSPAIATAAPDGMVKALTAGIAIIQATVAGHAATTAVTVQPFDSPAPAGVLAYHDFSDGSAGPYLNVWGTLIDFPNDPTGSGRGRVARMLFAPIESNKSADIYLAYGQLNDPLRYNRTIWMRGEVYFPSTALKGVRLPTDNRKTIDYYSPSGGARLVIHRRKSDITPTKNVLDISTLDAMGTGVLAETVYEETGIEIRDDTWYTIEVMMRTNSADNVRDGVVEIYINGETTPSYRRSTGLGWITEAWTGGSKFTTFRFGSQLSVQSPLYSEYRYWANVGFSTTRIGQ